MYKQKHQLKTCVILLLAVFAFSFRPADLVSEKASSRELSLSMTAYSYKLAAVNYNVGFRNDTKNILGLDLYALPTDPTPTRLDLYSDTQDFPDSKIGQTVTKTFVIRNRDSQALTLPSGVAIVGDYKTDFTVTRQPATTVAAGDYTSFDISFSPTTNNDITYSTSSPATYFQFPSNNLDADLLYSIGADVVLNFAPTATSVNFTGALAVGQQLSGTYTYADAESDTESGTSFKWYRSDDASGTNKAAIASATTETYTLTSAELGKYISFEVTPNDGVTAGIVAESSLQGAVLLIPYIASIVRQTPVDASTSADEVTFRVTFDKTVKNVDVTDFVLNGTAAGDGTVSTVTAINSAIYDVKITGVTSSNGGLNLDIKGNDGVAGNNNIISIYTGLASDDITINQPATDDYLSQSKIGQTFTAVRSNTLTKVTFFPKAGQHTFSGTANLKVYSGDETAGGTELTSESITFTSSTDAAGQTFTFAAPESLMAGNTYSIVLTSFSGVGYALEANKTVTYSAGHVIFTGQTSVHDDFDLKIKIYESVAGEIEGDALSTTAPTTDETYTIVNNTAPITTAPTTPSIIEDATNIPLADDIAIADADADSDNQTVTFTITGGTLTCGTEGISFGGEGNGTASYTAAGSLSSINTALDAATFTPTANLNGTGVGTIAFTTNDGSVDSNTASVTFDISAVNDAPTFRATALTTVNDNETYIYNFTTEDIDGDEVTVTATTKPNWLNMTTFAGAKVTTLAGSGGSGNTNANGTNASFKFASGVAVDASGNVYVGDNSNNVIRKIAPNGDVITLAGSGGRGSNDANGTNASFYSPWGVTVDALGNVYVADYSNHKVRKIAINGDVTTLAGVGTRGDTDANGTDASFFWPVDVAVDALGNVYVADSGNDKIRKIAPNGDVTTIAGASEGSTNGNGTNALFNSPRAIALDALGNVYVADFGNHRIRKIATNGDVTTLAGSGSYGSTDANGTAASFQSPQGIAVDASGNVYVGDTGSHKIRKIATNGDVTTLAGSGSAGSSDADGTAASFDSPYGVAVDPWLNVYVADARNHKIRKVEFPSLSGSAVGQTAGNHAVTLTANDGNGGTATQTFDINVVDVTAPILTSITTAGDFAENGTSTVYTTIGTDTNTLTYSLGTGDDNALFDIDGSTGAVTFKASPNFETPTDQGGDNGYLINVIATDAANNAANQNVTFAVTNVSDVNPIFTSTPITTVNDNETYSYEITTNDLDGDDVSLTGATVPDWLSLNQSQKGVTTFSGTGLNSFGDNGPGSGVSKDGSLSEASFSWPTDLVIDDQDNIYVLDRLEGKLRKIATDGNVTTIAGSGFGTQLGTGTNAKLKYPEAMALGNNNIMYVPSGFSRDSEDFIRKIDVVTGAVTAFAGGLKGIHGLAYDKVTDLLYVSHSGSNDENEILIFDAQGNKTVLAGNGSGFGDGTGTGAKFNYPVDLLLDGTGNLYVSDNGNKSIRKIDLATKIVTTFAGGSSGSNDGTGTDAQFSSPYGLAMDAQGNLYVSDRYGNFVIRKIDSKGVVTTVAGVKGEQADFDGSLETAKFYDPDGLAFDSNGNLLVTDNYSSKIRKISFNTAKVLLGDAVGVEAGSYPVTLTATDGNGGTATQIFDINVVDVTAPAKPIITYISADTGITTTDGITSDRNILVHGTAEANATVRVFSGNNQLGDTQVNAKGNWTFDATSIKLSERDYSVTTTATDVAGNASAISDTFVVTVDFTAPAKPVITHISDDTGSSNVDGITSDRNILVHGTAEANATVRIFSGNNNLGDTQVNAKGNWTFDATSIKLSERDYSVTTTATDVAGNASAISDTFVVTVDFTAPVLTSSTTANDFPENGTSTVYITIGTDTNTLTYSLGTGDDNALFNINGTSGAVTFKTSPDFEAPTDQGGDNDYVINVIASDGVNSVNQDVTITVTDVQEDVTGPVLIASNPSDGSTGFGGTTLVFTFDENIVKGTGRISVHDALTDSEIAGAGVGSSRVTVTNNVVSLDLINALTLDKEVYVRMPTGSLKDNFNNDFDGVLDKTTLNFSSLTTPTLVSTNPIDGADDFSSSTITFTFDRDMSKGTGRISLYDAADDSELSGAGVGSSRITINNNVVTMDLINPLPLNTEAYVNIPASAFKDVDNVYYPGISGKTDMNFATLTRPDLVSTNPIDGAVDFSSSTITFTFDQNMSKGTGRISLYDAADDSELTGAGVNSSRVTINNNVVTMDLINPLPFDREVYLKIPPAAFTDANNISFSGILDKTSINFATPTTPQLLSTDPVNGGIDFNSKVITFTFDRDVSKGRGRLRVFNRADDTEINGAGVNSSRVTITGNVVTLDLIKSLPSGISVYVKIPSVAFKDVNNRFYKGLLDKTTLNFNTLNTATGAPAAFNDAEVVDQQASLIQEELPLTVAINLYPNPASKVINIDLSAAGSAPDVRIIDVTGTEKLSIDKVKQRRLSLDVSQYAGGLYIAIVKTSTGQLIRKKFMIRR